MNAFTGVHRYDLGVMVDHRTTLNIRTARKLFTCHAAETREPAEGETAFVYVSDSMQKQMIVALLQCFLLAALVQSAPVSSPSNPSQTFKEAVERVMRLVEKIRKDVRSVHGSIINIDGLTLDPSSQTGELEMKRINLGIPDPPVLKELSEQFTEDMCVSRMLAGGRLYQGLLVDLSHRLGGLEALSAELRDLVTHINQMKDAAQLSSDSSDQSSLDLTLNLHGNYDVQVAAHLTLCQLLEFCHDLIRSLRSMAKRQMARGTR